MKENKEETQLRSAEEQSPSFYKLIAYLVTTYQMSPADWDLGPMSKRNWREISKRIEDHNDSLKILAVELKNKFESLKKGDQTEQRFTIEDMKQTISMKHLPMSL